jgi:hypothetical protein
MKKCAASRHVSRRFFLTSASQTIIKWTHLTPAAERLSRAAADDCNRKSGKSKSVAAFPAAIRKIQ